MTSPLLRPEKFGFFTAGSRTGVLSAGPSAGFLSLQETDALRKLAQISLKEGEDAALTGGTRSLSRRLLALNLAEFRSQPAAAARTHPPLSA